MFKPWIILLPFYICYSEVSLFWDIENVFLFMLAVISLFVYSSQITDWFDGQTCLLVILYNQSIWITIELAKFSFLCEKPHDSQPLHLKQFFVSNSRITRFLAPEYKLWCFCVTLFCYLSDVCTLPLVNVFICSEAHCTCFCSNTLDICLLL